MMRVRVRLTTLLVMAGLLGVGMSTAHAQGRGGRSGGGGGTPRVDVRSRMEILSDTFSLDKDQRKAMKATLDEAYTTAAPIREGLKHARAGLFEAIQSGQAAELDKAVDAYAAQAAAMADLEMKALAHILAPLRAEQRATGTMGAFALMRGIFLDDKKWDELPKNREY